MSKGVLTADALGEKSALRRLDRRRKAAVERADPPHVAVATARWGHRSPCSPPPRTRARSGDHSSGRRGRRAARSGRGRGRSCGSGMRDGSESTPDVDAVGGQSCMPIGLAIRSRRRRTSSALRPLVDRAQRVEVPVVVVPERARRVAASPRSLAAISGVRRAPRGRCPTAPSSGRRRSRLLSPSATARCRRYQARRSAGRDRSPPRRPRCRSTHSAGFSAGGSWFFARPRPTRRRRRLGGRPSPRSSPAFRPPRGPRQLAPSTIRPLRGRHPPSRRRGIVPRPQPNWRCQQ